MPTELVCFFFKLQLNKLNQSDDCLCVLPVNLYLFEIQNLKKEKEIFHTVQLKF